MVKTKIKLSLYDSDEKVTAEEIYFNNEKNTCYIDITIKDITVKINLLELSRAVNAFNAARSL